MTVGVLALQGDYQAHAKKLIALGGEVREVRRPRELKGLDGLVLPGGESSALIRLMDHEPDWWSALTAFHDDGKALFGTCAGMILLAREVTAPAQRSLALLDVVVERNGFGRQIDSFETQGIWDDGRSLEMVFIRAPRITHAGPDVVVRARHGEEPVLVEQGQVLAASFHPEMTSDDAVHRLFLEKAGALPDKSAAPLP
jgi:5'-phosphate synthase pdxT subunit